jgi:hypothetical protein
MSTEINQTPCLPQDLHIHTAYSHLDRSVVPEMTPALIASIGHACRIGISDHIECLTETFDEYEAEVRSLGLYLGMEVNGAEWAGLAIEAPTDYYIYHCRDNADDYRGAELLLTTGKPVVIAHPMMLGTNLERVPRECFLEINNRYVWKYDFITGFSPYIDQFNFVISSDAHQPNWIGQTTARWAAAQLGVEETLLFPVNNKLESISCPAR